VSISDCKKKNKIKINVLLQHKAQIEQGGILGQVKVWKTLALCGVRTLAL
jgi:hypothetical protein